MVVRKVENVDRAAERDLGEVVGRRERGVWALARLLSLRIFLCHGRNKCGMQDSFYARHRYNRESET